jgi:tetratricopeptide (TPR) repeat protein
LPEAERGRDFIGSAGFLRAQIAYAGGDVAGALGLYRRAAAQLSEAKAEEGLLGVLREQESVEHAHGHLIEALQTAGRIVAIAASRGNRLLRGRYEYERGMLLYKLGRLPEADVAAGRARAVFTELAFTSGLAECDKLLGNLCSARGEGEKALEYYESGFAVFKAAGDFLESANCRLNAAQVHARQGRRDQAEVLLDEAVLLYTRAGALGGVGLCQLSKGVMAFEAGDYLKADKALQTAEKMFSEKGDLYRLAQTKQALGTLCKGRGDVSRAVDYMIEADALYDRVRNLR